MKRLYKLHKIRKRNYQKIRLMQDAQKRMILSTKNKEIVKNMINTTGKEG